MTQDCKSGSRTHATKRYKCTVNNFKDFSFQDIACLFDTPLAQAARELKVSETHLKRLCRSCFGINRWPFRKIEALKNMRDKLQEAVTKERIAYRIEEKIKSIDAELELIRTTGNHSPSGPNTRN